MTNQDQTKEGNIKFAPIRYKITVLVILEIIMTLTMIKYFTLMLYIYSGDKSTICIVKTVDI